MAGCFSVCDPSVCRMVRMEGSRARCYLFCQLRKMLLPTIQPAPKKGFFYVRVRRIERVVEEAPDILVWFAVSSEAETHPSVPYG